MYTHIHAYAAYRTTWLHTHMQTCILTYILACLHMLSR